MADAALLMAVEKLGNIAVEKVSSLFNVAEQVTQLKDELQMMQCFLRDAAKKQAKEERIRKWISDVREVAFDAEDAVDTFAHKVNVPRKGLLERCMYFPEHVYHLNKLGQEMESIQKRLKDINERRVRYGIQHLDEERMASSDSVERRRRMSPWQPDKHIVGLEEHVKTLLRKAILIEKEGLSIASIVGMGGAGKSTLAKKVYNHTDVCQQFECRAWVTMSRDFSPKGLLKKLLLQLGPREASEHTNMENLPEEYLEQMVHRCLQGTQYFIVVDDVWRQQDWEYVARAFPDETDKTSRLLITSRVHNIPRTARYVHELKGLDPIQSWKLFLKAAISENNDGKCPHELQDIGKRIVEKCNGLPLAISVMGGLLLEQGQVVRKWERVLKGIKTHLEAGEDSVSAILELSYHDLNPHLKSCFLYLSFFKEDDVINVEMLIAIWIAEGIVPQGNGEETMEEIAYNYLDELINRNMVQVIGFSIDGQVKRCRMHDLLRDLSITRSKEEIKFSFLHNENTSFDEYWKKACHLAICCNKESLMSSWNPNSHLRTLFFWACAGGDHHCFPPIYWKRFGGCLRVLQLKNLGLETVPKRIGSLVGLRYLGLNGNEIQWLPRSLGHLSNLQTLDISFNGNVKVPNVIWKLERLRHLYLSHDMICEEPLKLDTLKNLQTLKFVSTEKIVVDHLAKLVSLHELDITLAMNVDVNKLITLLAKLENLVSLSLDNWCHGTVLSLDGIVNLQHLAVLSIHGELEKLPNYFPQNLSYLLLIGTHLNEDPMPILGKLPNLLHLTLSRDFCVDTKLVIASDDFPRLKHLVLSSMLKAKQIYIEKRGLPELNHLVINICQYLEILPEEELKRIMGNLKNLKIIGPTSETGSRLKRDYSHIISDMSTA